LAFLGLSPVEDEGRSVAIASPLNPADLNVYGEWINKNQDLSWPL